MGTFRNQHFFAMRVTGPEMRFPFPSRPFTALVELSRSLSEDEMRYYAKSLVEHGCVQAVCRGEDSDLMTETFERLTEHGEYDSNNTLVTALSVSDEPLVETVQYFILPCDLAQTGLMIVIGDNDAFQERVEGFSTAMGEMKKEMGEAVYTDTDVVCFVST